MKLNKILTAVLTAILALSLVACSGKEDSTAKEPSNTPEQQTTTLKIGASPAPHAEILEFVKPALAEKGVDLEIEIFTDYVLPNNAVESGDLDANFFQHEPYMVDFNEKNGTSLVNVAKIHFEPLGIYPGKTATIEEVAEGASIGVPNDSTNEARALLLLETNGLITLKEGVGLQATINDIVENPKNLKIEEIEAAQLPRSLPDLDLAVINGNYALPAGIGDTALTTEDPQSEHAQKYANIIAVKDGNQENEAVQALVEALQSDDVKEFLSEKYGVTVLPVF